MFAKSKLSLILRLLAVATAAWLPIAASSARVCCFSCGTGSLVEAPRHCCHTTCQSDSTDQSPKCPQETCHCSDDSLYDSSLAGVEIESSSDSLDMVLPVPQPIPPQSGWYCKIIKVSRSSTQTCAVLSRFLC